MNRKHTFIAPVLALCLLLFFTVLPSKAENADGGGVFFSGYRWLNAYSALFSASDMDQCVGITTEKGLVWAVSRQGQSVLVRYADPDGAACEAYVEEARTARAARTDIDQWLADTGKKQVEVEKQSLPPLSVSQLTEGGAAVPSVLEKTAAAEKPEILSQPADQTVQAGEEASFSVSALHATAFQWQYSKDGGKTWGDLRNREFWLGCKTDTLRFTAADSHNGFLFRCLVSNKAGSLESLPARLTLPGKVVPFDEKPADCTAAPGEEVTFHARLQGADKLQWQYSKDEGKTWGNLTNGEFWRGNRTDTLTFTADSKHDGFLFRCSAALEGETVCSDSARLTIESQAMVPPAIQAQTGDIIVHEGEEVTLSVEAEGAQTYQWQYSRDKGKTWANFRNSKVWDGSEAATLTFKASLSQDEMLFRCAVSNAAGTAESKPILLSVLFK